MFLPDNFTVIGLSVIIFLGLLLTLTKTFPSKSKNISQDFKNSTNHKLKAEILVEASQSQSPRALWNILQHRRLAAESIAESNLAIIETMQSLEHEQHVANLIAFEKLKLESNISQDAIDRLEQVIREKTSSSSGNSTPQPLETD